MQGKVRLTKREAEVLRLIARGCTHARVGEVLGVSLHTAASYLRSAYRKLDAHSAVRAVVRTMELNLLGSFRGGRR